MGADAGGGEEGKVDAGAGMETRASPSSNRTTSSSFLAAMDVRAKDVAETRASPSSKPSDCQSKQAEWARQVGRRISDDLRSQITQLI